MHKELIKNLLIMLSVMEKLGVNNVPFTDEQGREIESKLAALYELDKKLPHNEQMTIYQEIFTDAMKEFLCYKLN